MSYLDISIPDDRGVTAERLRTLMDGAADSYRLEKQFIRKDGTWFWGNISVTTFHAEHGEVEGAVIIVADITERKRAELALQQAHEQLKGWVVELEGHNREMVLLNAMSDRLHRCERVDDAYDVVRHFAAQLFGEYAGALYIFNPEQNMLEAVVCWGDVTDLILPVNDTGCTLSLAECNQSTAGTSHRIGCPQMLEQRSGRICVSLRAQGEVFGLVRLQYVGADPTIGHTSIERLVRIVAEHLSLALANRRLRQRLHEMAVRDPLTGLFNRRYLDETLAREIRRAQRHQLSIGVIMMDIDHFKRFNDTYGHDVGDALLREMGKFLSSHIRGSDIACRYGGEEFTLILPGASPTETMKRAQELHIGARQIQILHQGTWLGNVTISVGVATFPDHGKTDDEVIKAADKALFLAKQRGRDRVMMGWRKGTTGMLVLEPE